MKISCLLLAEGQSQRMAGVNKLTLKIGDQSLVKGTLSEIKKVALCEIIVVTGQEHLKMAPELQGFGARIIFNENYKSGMHSSIREGLKSLSACDAFFICLADQPYFDHTVLVNMLEALPQKNGAPSIMGGPKSKSQ